MSSLNDFDLLTLTDVAQLLRCSKAHVCKAVMGRVPGCPPLPAVSLGRRKLIRRAVLHTWIAENEAANTPMSFPLAAPKGCIAATRGAQREAPQSRHSN